MKKYDKANTIIVPNRNGRTHYFMTRDELYPNNDEIANRIDPAIPNYVLTIGVGIVIMFGILPLSIFIYEFIRSIV